MTKENMDELLGLKGELFDITGNTGIYKYFRGSIREINKIPLGVMTSDSPRGKSFTLRNCWGSNILPRKKGNYYSNLPPSSEMMIY